MPWWVWALLVAAALAVALTGRVLDYRLRRRAIEKVPAQRVVDVLNAAPASAVAASADDRVAQAAGGA